MNKLFSSKKNKVISLILIGGLILSSGLTYGYYRGSTVSASSKTEKEMKTAEKEISKNYPTLLKSHGENLGKVETTYAIMDNDSNIKDVVVSEQLSNSSNSNELRDFSTLDKVENTSGNEKYIKNGNDIIWKAKGNRIFYKGKATAELPVRVNVSYYLNGKKKTPKEIAGKSGNIKIRFEYDIKKKDVVNDKTYLHPYTMASGLVFDNAHFSDIKVTNGKSIDDGNKTVAFGVAMPGMNENLGVNKSKLNIPSIVEISAFTDKFNIMGTYSIAMSGIVNDIDTEKPDELKAKAETLNLGLEKLSSSSKELLKGTETLESGATQLNDGIEGLNKGIGKLQNGSSQLLSGIKTLNTGLRSLSNNSSKIKIGIAQLEASIFETATTQLKDAIKNENITLTPKTYIQVINGISDGATSQAEAKLREALSSQGVKDKNIQTQILSVAYNNLMSQNKTKASRKNIEEAIKEAGEIAKKAAFVGNAMEKNSKKVVPLLKLKGYSEDQITPEITAVASTAFELAGGNPLEVESKISEATEICKVAEIFKNGAINAEENLSKFAAIAVGKETPSKLVDLKNKLDQVEALVAGINQYTIGVDSAAGGSDKLLAAIMIWMLGLARLRTVQIN